MKARRSAELLAAVHKCDWQRVGNLLELGADVNVQGRRGDSPLMVVAQKGITEACCALLEQRANPNVRDKGDGRTALIIACSLGAGDTHGIVRALLEAAADANARDCSMRTPLMHATACGRVDVARTLLENRADVNATASSEGSAVNVSGIHSKVVNRIISGEGPDALNKYMQRQRRRAEEAEQHAVEEDFERDRLCTDENDADTGVTATPAHEGLTESNLRAPAFGPRLGVFLEQDHEPSECGSRMSGMDSDSQIYTDMFISRVAPLRPCDMASQPQSDERLRKLMNQSTELRNVIPRPLGSGSTSLFTAAQSGHAELCALLLENHADPSIVVGDQYTSALCVAAHRGHTEACQVLVSSEFTQQVHEAALRMAEISGHEDVVKILRGYHTFS